MPSIFMIRRSADSAGLPSIVKSKEDSEIDYNYDDSSRWQPFSRTVKAPNLAVHLQTPLAIVPKSMTFSNIPWTRHWTPRCPPRMPCAEWFRRDDERKIKRAKDKKKWLEGKAKEEARAVESATRRASFEINTSPDLSLGARRQLRPRSKKSYTGNNTVKSKGDNKKGENIKSKVDNNGDDIKSKSGKKGDNAKSKIVDNVDSAKSKESKKKSKKRTLKESNANEIKRVAVEVALVALAVEVALDTKAVRKVQAVDSDVELVAMRGEKEKEKEEEVDEENKENARPKRAKRDNVRLSGYAKKWSL